MNSLHLLLGILNELNPQEARLIDDRKNVNYIIILDMLIYTGAENPIERGLVY